MSAQTMHHDPIANPIDREPTDTLPDFGKALLLAVVAGCMVLAFHVIALASGGAL